MQYTYFTNRPIPTGDITLTATARENDGQTMFPIPFFNYLYFSGHFFKKEL